MSSWDELNKSAGAKPVQTVVPSGAQSGGWAAANASAKRPASADTAASTSPRVSAAKTVEKKPLSFGRWAANVGSTILTSIAETVPVVTDYASRYAGELLRGGGNLSNFIFNKTLETAANAGAGAAGFPASKVTDPLSSKFDKTVKSVIQKVSDKPIGDAQKLAGTVSSNDYVAPSKSWQEASWQDRFKPENLKETAFMLSSQGVGSMVPILLNAPAGLLLATAPTVGEMKRIGRENGVDEGTSDAVALTAGLLIGFIDSKTPGNLTSVLKENLAKSFGGVLFGGLKTATKEGVQEVIQEDLQVAAETVLGKKLDWDEIAGRNVTSFAGGSLVGGGMSTFVDSINKVRSKAVQPQASTRSGNLKPAPANEATVSTAKARLQELDERANYSMLTSVERAERNFLRENSTKPEKLAQGYSIRVSTPVVDARETVASSIGNRSANVESVVRAQQTLDDFYTRNEREVIAVDEVATIRIVEYEDGKFGYAYKVLTPKNGIQSEYSVNPLSDSAETAIERARREVLNYANRQRQKNPEAPDAAVLQRIATEVAKIVSATRAEEIRSTVKSIAEEAVPTDTLRRETGPKENEATVAGLDTASSIDPENPRQSRVYARLKSEMPQELPGDVSYNAINLKEDTRKAVDLVGSDKQKAYRVAMGLETVAGQTSTSVNIALAEAALESGNTALFAQLTKARSLAQTRRGQEIVAEKGSVTENSAARYVKELISERMAALGEEFMRGIQRFKPDSTPQKKAMAKIDADVKEAQAAMKKNRMKRFDVEAAQKLIDSLACA